MITALGKSGIKYVKDYLAVRSLNGRILAAVATVAGLTFAAKMAATIKDVVVAGVFGIGSTVDAFLIAFLLPTFIATIVGNSFNAALVPTYIEVREQAGQDAAHRLFSGTVLLSTLLLIIVT